MKIKVITSYKPGSWEIYAKKGIESMAQQFPKEIDIVVYAEEPKPQCKFERISGFWYSIDNMKDLAQLSIGDLQIKLIKLFNKLS